MTSVTPLPAHLPPFLQSVLRAGHALPLARASLATDAEGIDLAFARPALLPDPGLSTKIFLAGLPAPFVDAEAPGIERLFRGWLEALHPALLGRAPAPDELEACGRQMVELLVRRGLDVFAAGAELVEQIRISDPRGAAHSPRAWINELFSDLLGRLPDAAELGWAEELVQLWSARGAGPHACWAQLERTLRGLPDCSQYGEDHPLVSFINGMFHTGLARSPTLAERARWEQRMEDDVARGANVFQAGARAVADFKALAEYRQLHPFVEALEATYHACLQRAATLDEVNRDEAVLICALARGQILAEALAGVAALLRSSDEYQRKHAQPPALDLEKMPAVYRPWVPHVEAAARRHALPPALLLAMISRESEGLNRVGREGHGHGLMQIDDRLWGQWLARNGAGLDPASNIMKGAEILRSNIDYFRGNLRHGVAAYDCGPHLVERALQRGLSPDAYTSSGNYSADVLARQSWFS